MSFAPRIPESNMHSPHFVAVGRFVKNGDGRGHLEPRLLYRDAAQMGRLASRAFTMPRRSKGLEMAAAVLEAIMLVCFGLSWPINAMKAWKSGTAVGTSWMFLGLITLGYVAGIAAKFVGGNVNWVLAVYFLNLAALVANWLIYARNRRLDAQRKKARA